MLDRFHMDFADTQRATLMQYCKMENITLSALLHDSKPKSKMKIRMEATAFHLLQRIDKRLNAMISRLTTDMEHSGVVQRRLS